VPADQVPGWIAAMSSLGWILALPLAPFWGVLADRYSRKLIIVRSAAIEAIVFGGWALSTSPWMALLFRSLNGFILGNTGVMLAVQASTTPKQRLALAVGIVAAGSPAGRAVGPILGALLVHYVDVRGMLLFDSALSIVMAVLLMVFMRETDHARPADLRVLSLLRGALDEIVSKPLVWRLFLATAITQVGLWTILPYAPIYIARLAPNNVVNAVGVVLSAVGLGQAVASPLWGIVMQRFGHVAVLNVTSIGAFIALDGGRLQPYPVGVRNRPLPQWRLRGRDPHRQHGRDGGNSEPGASRRRARPDLVPVLRGRRCRSPHRCGCIRSRATGHLRNSGCSSASRRCS